MEVVYGENGNNNLATKNVALIEENAQLRAENAALQVSAANLEIVREKFGIAVEALNKVDRVESWTSGVKECKKIAAEALAKIGGDK